MNTLEAATFLAEYSPPSQRGIYTSLVPASTACGLLAGSLTATGMFSMLSDSAVNTWGWRIPFLLSGPLGLIGRYIRVHLEDSPAYQEMRAEMPQEQKSAGWSRPLRVFYEITGMRLSSPSESPASTQSPSTCS